MLGYPFAIVVSLADGAVETFEPEVVVGSLVGLGKT